MRRHLSLILKIITILAIVTFLVAIFVTSQKQDAIKKDLNTLMALQSVKPKDGKNASVEQIRKAVVDYIAANPVKDGQNATDEQVKQAVEEYFVKNPVKQPKDAAPAKNGADGKTPEIQCNVEKNRWEVRFGPEENWQLMNGKKAECTVRGGDETNPLSQR